jgi:hypothetical protein
MDCVPAAGPPLSASKDVPKRKGPMETVLVPGLMAVLDLPGFRRSAKAFPFCRVGSRVAPKSDN